MDALPEGVLDVVERRLSRLDDAVTNVLSLASVAGVSFTRALLAHAARVDDVDDALGRAVAARLLTENGRGGFTFAHAIVRDALLRSQTASARAKGHRDIASALLAMGAGDDALYDLAYHYCGAAMLGFTLEAARYSVAAAEASIRSADVIAAIDILERAWTVLDEVDPIDHEARFTVLSRLAEMHYRLLDGKYDALEAAAVSARALRSPETIVQTAYFAYRWDISVDDSFGLDLINDALALLPPGPSVTRAGALAASAYLRNMQAQSGGAQAAAQSLSMLGELGEPDTAEANMARKYAGMAFVGNPGAAEHLAILESFDIDGDGAHEGFERSVYLANKLELHVRLADRQKCDEVGAQLEAELARTAEPTAGVYSRGWRVIKAFMEGRFDELPDLMTAAMPTAGVAVTNIAAVYAAWTMWLAYEEGRSAEIIDNLRVLVLATGSNPSSTSPYAVHLTEVGIMDEAHSVVERLVDQLPTLPRNAQFGTIIALTAAAAAMLGDPVFAQPLLDELDPFAGEIMLLPSVVVLGAADRFRGQMLMLLGRRDEAIEALEAAIALETRLGAPPLVKRSQYWLERARSS
jgi:tetratricopeptide (TPR) repeat protein